MSEVERGDGGTPSAPSAPAAKRRRVGVIGSMVWDVIYGRDKRAVPVEECRFSHPLLAAIDSIGGPFVRNHKPRSSGEDSHDFSGSAIARQGGMNLADNGIAHHNIAVLRTPAHQKPFTEERIDLGFCVIRSLDAEFRNASVSF